MKRRLRKNWVSGDCVLDGFFSRESWKGKEGRSDSGKVGRERDWRRERKAGWDGEVTNIGSEN